MEPCRSRLFDGESSSRAFDISVKSRCFKGTGFLKSTVPSKSLQSIKKCCKLSGDPAIAVNYEAAHGALAMTTPGDTTMASVDEVEKLMGGGTGDEDVACCRAGMDLL
jgi:hypothetical protein